MLGKDTELTSVRTYLFKTQYQQLDKIANMRKISKAKLIRHIVEDYLKRLLVLGQNI